MPPGCRMMPTSRNVELHRRITEAFNARDIEGVIAYCNPQIEWHSTFAAVGGGVYRGHDGLRRMDRDFEEIWGGGVHIEPEAYFDLGDQTLAFAVLHGRGLHSGAEVALPAAFLGRWSGGLLVYFKGYSEKEDALSDLGVTEDSLEPISP